MSVLRFFINIILGMLIVFISACSFFKSDVKEICLDYPDNSREDIINECQVANVVKNVLAISGDVHVKKLKGGLSRAKMFIVSSGDKKYVVRFLTHKSLKKRRAEVSSLKIASRMGYGPNVYFVSDDESMIIMEYLNFQPITDEQRASKELYKMLGHLLKKIHSGPSLQKTIDVFSPKRLSELKIKYNTIIPKILLNIENKLREIQQVVTPYVVTAPCHIDLNPNNIMFLGDDFKVIDYETAAQADPYFDVAVVCVFNCFSSSSEETLLKAYLNREPTAIEKARLYLMKQVALMNYLLIFLKLTEQKKMSYKKIKILPDLNFLKNIGSIDMEDSENQLKFSKILINLLLKNFESNEFKNAVKVLRGSNEK